MNRTPPQALLYVPPKMTKTEVKEYLSKIYSVNVLAVMTANFLGMTYFHFYNRVYHFNCYDLSTALKFLGKWKRFYGKRKVISYKRRNFKKALVHFEKPVI